MGLHNFKLLVSKLSGLCKNAVRHTDFTAVVKKRNVIYAVKLLSFKSHFLCNKFCIYGNPLRMTVCIRVFCINKACKCFNGFIDNLIIPLMPQLVFLYLPRDNHKKYKRYKPKQETYQRYPEQRLAREQSVEGVVDFQG